MTLPLFDASGDLPPGVYQATLQDVIARFGIGSLRRRVIAGRLERIYHVASETGHLRRFVVFGSFVTAKVEPNDVDVFLLMEDAFDVRQLRGEARLLFDHTSADAHFGASVFWVRRLAALEGEEAMVAHWQIRRDGARRGLVEIVGLPS